MRSLRARLFILLLAATALVWSAAAAWTYFHTRTVVQRVLDRRLVEAAGMVASLAQGSAPLTGAPTKQATLPLSEYNRQLSCQIWTLDWRLVGRSGSAPQQPLGLGQPGFSERMVNGESWRVYTLVNPELGLRILVGDNLQVRRNLIGDVMQGLLLPALTGIIGLSLLLWAGVGTGLQPLRRVARELAARDPSDHRRLETGNTAGELLPVVHAINGLFSRLEQLRANERHFIASAAHELQTPLAGLRAHAQLAMTAEASQRDKSLRAIQASVDRTSRLVQQLLDLSREEANAEKATPTWLSLGPVIRNVAEELTVLSSRKHVEVVVERSAANAQLYIEEPSLLLALRNLLKNAIEHAPEGSCVEVSAGSSDAGDTVAICDSGQGIPPAELSRIRDRFVRGSRAKGEGSGLGLSIVELVVERNGGTLQLNNSPGGGLRAEMRFAPGLLRWSDAAPPTHVRVT